MPHIGDLGMVLGGWTQGVDVFWRLGMASLGLPSYPRYRNEKKEYGNGNLPNFSVDFVP